MSAFNLARFRELAFSSRVLPNHPMHDLDAAHRLLALAPEDDPQTCIAELTRWTVSLNRADDFTPGRRARILMLLDDAARTHWRALGARYLAPKGIPTEHVDGDPLMLRELYDSACEFANGFAITLDESEHSSRWVTENQVRLMIRSMRWLGRRLALAHMLAVPYTTTVWDLLHRRRALAVVRGLAANAMPAFEGVRHPTSVTREYLRAILLELAAPDSVRPRMLELIYRVAARVASAARLQLGPSDETAFALIPIGHGLPVTLDRLKPGPAPALYVNTVNCLPRLRAARERDMGRDPDDEDTLFGRGFTLRERNEVLERLLDHWGLNPPKRRYKRLSLALAARVVSGFDNVAGVVPALESPQFAKTATGRSALRLQLDETTKSLKRAKLRAARVGPARVVDASTGGLGLALQRREAHWAKHGALLAILIEPGKDWFVGVLRRIVGEDEELRLGIQIIAAKPRKLLLYTPAVRDHMVWEEAILREKSFGEHYRYGILLEPQRLPLAASDLLLPPAMASRGSQFDVPLPGSQQRISIARLVVDGDHFQRALFEPLGVRRA